MAWYVFVPRICSTTILHGSPRGTAFKLHDFSSGPHNKPRMVLDQSPDYLWEHLQNEAYKYGFIEEAPGDVKRDDTRNRPIWHRLIGEANRKYLTRILEANRRYFDGQNQTPPNEDRIFLLPDAPTPIVKTPTKRVRVPVQPESDGLIVPKTELRHLYQVLDDFPSKACHLALATEAARVPKRLAARFSRSVNHFNQYDNRQETFVPDTRRKPLPKCSQLTQIDSTNSLTAFLTQSCCGNGNVNEHPDLNFQLVEREVIAARTTGRAKHEDGTSAQRGKQLDWLLSNSQDRTPIVCELKVKEDKNSFYALVQSLMYASELVTDPQISRLEQCYPDHFGGLTSPPIDIYLVLSGFNVRSQENRDIFDATKRLCKGLVLTDEMQKYIRRIVCLDACLNLSRQLVFSCLFRCGNE